MTTGARRHLGWGLLAPALVLFTVYFVAPQLGLLVQSVESDSGPSLAQYRRFFGDGFYLGILLNSFALGLCVTVATLLLGLPVAFLLARWQSPWAATLLLLCSFPLWVSAVVRSFAWMILFFRNGVISQGIRATGLVPPDYQVLGTFLGVAIALTQVMLPIMILMLYPVLRRIDGDMELASLSLGEGPFRTFLLVTLPLAKGGILSGSLIVFSLAVSAFASPSMIGGSRAHFLAVSIYQQVLEILNWPFASAMATILLGVAIMVASLAGYFGREGPSAGARP